MPRSKKRGAFKEYTEDARLEARRHNLAARAASTHRALLFSRISGAQIRLECRPHSARRPPCRGHAPHRFCMQQQLQLQAATAAASTSRVAASGELRSNAHDNSAATAACTHSPPPNNRTALRRRATCAAMGWERRQVPSWPNRHDASPTFRGVELRILRRT